MTHFLERIENRTALICGAAVSLFGLGVMAGWILHLPALIQIWPGYAAMQFNSAVGQMMVGLGLIWTGRNARLAAACGILSALLGAATLLEYALKLSLYIDDALFHPWLAAEVPARMSVNSAACLLIGGLALLCANAFPRLSAKAALFGGYSLVIIAGSALTGYGLDIEVAYRWAEQTRMSVPAAAAFLLTGAGLCRFGWKHLVLNRTLWLTWLTGGGVAGVSILTWAAVAAQYRKMGGPRSVPDLMLFTGITRACIAAIAVFLWRNSRDRLFRVEILNSNLREKITERTAQLQAIFAAVRVGTWTTDLASNRTVIHGRSNEVFGFPPDQGEHSLEQILETIHPDDRAKLRQASRDVADGRLESIDQEVRLVWPDKSEHWALVQGGISQFADGRPACLSGITLDVTRLKDAEAALQRSEAEVRQLNQALERRVRIQTKELMESERRFRLMVEGLRDYAFFMLDTEGRVMSWNQGAESITGYTSVQIIGQHFSIMCTGEDLRTGQPQMRLHLAAEHGRFEETGWRVRRDGVRFWAHVITTAVHDEAGHLCGYSNVTRDITERKRSLEQVEEQRKRAEESNQAKSRFLASMSHEIRTPMNAILGMTDLLWETELDEEQRHFLEIFRRAGTNLMDLINDILDLSKIESGRLELEKAEFDLGAVVDDVVELLLPKASDKGIALRARIAAGVTRRVTGDSARLRQVLVNLVGNAIKFTSSGDVVISIDTPESGAAGELSFAVSDTGIGIPQDKLSTIFDAFAQVDASVNRKYGGTGLGLAICQRLVECMGGVLRAESEPGRGSKFHFTAKFEAAATPAPPAQPRLEPRQAAPAQTNGVAKSARILVAEDSVDNQFLIEAYLKHTPYAASFVGDGQAAVKQYREGKFDLILMDVQMPVMDGLTATRTIRDLESRQSRRAVPILALTANAQREAIEASRTAGCTAHLAKPISKSGLLRALEQYLSVASEPPPAPPAPVSVKAPDGLGALAPRYLSARRKELPEMVALLAAADFEQIVSRGHNMKGTGRSYGFPDLTEIGAALERSAKHKDKDGVDKQLLRLANYLESVRVEEGAATEPRR